MPKTYDHGHHRSTRHRSSRRSQFTLIHLGVLIVIAGLVLSWWLNSTANAVTNAFTLPQAYSLRGQPTIDAAFIDKVLTHYDSPAAGKGQALYDDGVKYDIDPAYALAFFMHESSFGTRGIAVVTHSLGNIRATSGYASYDGYRAYPTWEAGFEDWYRLISKQYIDQWGLSTVDQIIPVYAPSSDNNDEAAYINSVKNAVDTWQSGQVAIG